MVGLFDDDLIDAPPVLNKFQEWEAVKDVLRNCKTIEELRKSKLLLRERVDRLLAPGTAYERQQRIILNNLEQHMKREILR